MFVTTAARLMRICCVTTRVLRTTTCASTKKPCVIKRTSQLLPMLEIADVSCLVWCFPVFDVALVAKHHMMSRCMSRLTLHSASCHAAATQWLNSKHEMLYVTFDVTQCFLSRLLPRGASWHAWRDAAFAQFCQLAIV